MQVSPVQFGQLLKAQASQPTEGQTQSAGVDAETRQTVLDLWTAQVAVRKELKAELSERVISSQDYTHYDLLMDVYGLGASNQPVSLEQINKQLQKGRDIDVKFQKNHLKAALGKLEAQGLIQTKEETKRPFLPGKQLLVEGTQKGEAIAVQFQAEKNLLNTLG